MADAGVHPRAGGAPKLSTAGLRKIYKAPNGAQSVTGA